MAAAKLVRGWPVIAGVVAFALTGAASPAASGATWTPPAPTYQANDYSHGQVMSILPPGENGFASAADIANYEATGQRPAGSEDQRIKYANLLYAHNLTNDQLPNYYNDESLGIQPQNVISTEQPSATVPVVIYRDQHHVPHIYGQSETAVVFGAGYAAAEDRLFMMDVLRHYGGGTLSQFLGPSCADEQMDHDQLLLTGYSQTEKQEQLDNLVTQYGALGAQFNDDINSYVAGINAYITATRTNPSLVPGDYAAALEPPLPFKPTDIIDIASLVGGIFGKGGGIEVQNAALLQYLEKQLNDVTAAHNIFTDLKEQNDPAAPTTITGTAFPYENPGTIDPTLTAIPDNAGAPLSGGPTDTTPGCDGTPPNPAALQTIASLLQLPKAMSNALLVDAAHSATGHPLAVFGPQVSYFNPEILMEEEMEGPDFSVEGASFPGTNLIVELGRGVDYAWSATSAGSDNVDQVVELICDPNGGAPQPQGTYYEYQGRCLSMEHKTFTERAVPKPACAPSPCAPAIIKHDIYDTIHGVVQGWTTVGGKPVAIVNERSTYMHELDSGVGFYRWQRPSLTYDATSWMQGAAGIQYTFNWFYADSSTIAYYQSGRDPIRPSGVDPNLPTWGTGAADWQGFLDFAGHPHEIGSPTGYITSWNNKPAPEFSAADDEYGYGPVHRVQSLNEEIERQFSLHSGKITRADLVTAMETAAVRDLSGRQVVPDLLAEVGGRTEPAGVQAMLDQLRSWEALGAPRKKTDAQQAQYAQAAAVAIFDELYPRLTRAFFDSLFAAGGVQTVDGLPSGYTAVPMEFANTPHNDGAHLGSAYLGGWEGYDQKLLDMALGKSVPQPFSADLTSRVCGGGGLAGCGQAVDDALAQAYNALVAANGGNDVAGWTQDTATKQAGVTMPQYDAIVFRAIGVIAQPTIDWQNRPTFQQVVEFPAHRDLTSASVPEVPLVPLALLSGAAALAVRLIRRRGRLV